MSDELKKIEEYGELQFSPSDMLAIFEKDDFSEEEEKAYRKGMLKADAIIRREIYNSAKDGDQAAIKKMLELIERAKEENS